MRIIVMCCWTAVMIAFLFTSDLIALLDHGALDIQMTSHPDFSFFEIYEIRFDVLIQKIGHLFMFAIWVLTIFFAIKRLKAAVWITLGLAFASELIQPYFTRDGHLLDVAFDSIGILLMAFLIHVFLEVASGVGK
ncbi:VanZ family protein [Virgibacillus sp. NKC19-3]|uniref:VanZ family protein n=1 Tax=Virgibacillus saliphilus TaxID=2831674 RepID=UPI001C9AD614|nr:VanZ family protein [Virgibacillus sp. NKC19-3]MBY7145088.1 VanZ family protein [Virgibacillus sp. NKC19-3]